MVEGNINKKNPAEFAEGAYICKRYWHFHRRIYERYGGLVLGPGEFDYIVTSIRNGGAPKIIESNISTTRVINIRGRNIYLVVNKFDSVVVTALPPKEKHFKKALEKQELEDKRLQRVREALMRSRAGVS